MDTSMESTRWTGSRIAGRLLRLWLFACTQSIQSMVCMCVCAVAVLTGARHITTIVWAQDTHVCTCMNTHINQTKNRKILWRELAHLRTTNAFLYRTLTKPFPWQETSNGWRIWHTRGRGITRKVAHTKLGSFGASLDHTSYYEGMNVAKCTITMQQYHAEFLCRHISSNNACTDPDLTVP